MTTLHKAILVAVLILVPTVACIIKFAVEEHEARIHAEATAAADDKLIAARQQDIAQRDAQAAQYADALTKAAAGVHTPAQAAQVITRYLPAVNGTPAAPVLTVDRQDLPAADQAKLPNTPGPVVVLSADQAKDVATNDLACDAAQHSLQACTADKADLQKELAAQKDETDTWKAAAKGGTKWQRTLRLAKCLGEAGGGAYLASRFSKSPAAPALGAAAGTVTCTLF